MTDAAAEIDALRTALAAAEARADAMEAEATHAKAVLSGSEALIAHLRLGIEKLRRALHGQRSERRQRLLDQLELQLEGEPSRRHRFEPDGERDHGLRGRGARRGRRGEGEDAGRRLRAPQARPQAVPGAPAARAGRDRGAEDLQLLRVREAREAGRGRHGDARGHPAPVESDPDGPREGHLPGLRAHHPAAIRHRLSDRWRDDGSSFHPTPRARAPMARRPRICPASPDGAGPSLLAFAVGLEHMATHWLTPLRERAVVRHWSEDNGERPAPAAEPPGRQLMPARASSSACRRSPTGSARPPRRWRRSTP
jgi:hypothetical protein